MNGGRWLVLTVVALGLAGGAVLLSRDVAPGDSAQPSGEAVRDAIYRVVPTACETRPEVHDVEELHSPDLPFGMKSVREITCGPASDVDGVGHTVAIDYRFDSASDARAWLRQSDYHLGDASHYGWRLHGSTLIGNVDLTPHQWRGVLVRLGL